MQFVFDIMTETMLIEITGYELTVILFPKHQATVNQIKLSSFTYLQKNMNVWIKM